jgi:hypothetical protein
MRIRDRPALDRSGVLSSVDRVLCVRFNPALRVVGDGGDELSSDSGNAGVMVKSWDARPKPAHDL